MLTNVQIKAIDGIVVREKGSVALLSTTVTASQHGVQLSDEARLNMDTDAVLVAKEDALVVSDKAVALFPPRGRNCAPVA
jgi:hypothetical protein